jgi:hypothetical protein
MEGEAPSATRCWGLPHHAAGPIGNAACFFKEFGLWVEGPNSQSHDFFSPSSGASVATGGPPPKKMLTCVEQCRHGRESTTWKCTCVLSDVHGRGHGNL